MLTNYSNCPQPSRNKKRRELASSLWCWRREFAVSKDGNLASFLTSFGRRTPDPDLLLNRAADLAANVTRAFCEYYESIALPTLLKKNNGRVYLFRLVLAKGIVRPRSGGKRSETERLHPVSSLLLRNVISNCPIAIHPRWRSIRSAKKGRLYLSSLLLRD